MSQLTIALPKGRLLDPSIELLESLGYDLRDVRDTRKLVIENEGVRFLIAKPMDVSIYVEYGAADAGIVGQDALRESECDVYEPNLLQFGFCRLVVAGKREYQSVASSQDTDNSGLVSNSPRLAAPNDWKTLTGLRVATKYPKCAQKYFSARGLAVEIIEVYGSVELAPVVGLADLIVDVVDTGRTLKENGLVELDELFKSQATFIVNRASHTLRASEIRDLLEKIQSQRVKVRAQN